MATGQGQKDGKADMYREMKADLDYRGLIWGQVYPGHEISAIVTINVGLLCNYICFKRRRRRNRRRTSLRERFVSMKHYTTSSSSLRLLNCFS